VTQAKNVPSGFSKSRQGEAPQGFLDDAVEFEKSSSASSLLGHLERGLDAKLVGPASSVLIGHCLVIRFET
jgi:hypothetical protein